jgi:hypothetical protein
VKFGYPSFLTFYQRLVIDVGITYKYVLFELHGMALCGGVKQNSLPRTCQNSRPGSKKMLEPWEMLCEREENMSEFEETLPVKGQPAVWLLP